MASEAIDNNEPKAKRPLEDDETVVAGSGATEAPKPKKKKKKAAKPSEEEVAARRAAFEAKWYADQETYLWFKAECDPAKHGGLNHYYFHKKSRKISYTEPGECYWIYDPATNSVDVDAGLQNPTPLNSEAPVQAKPSPAATGEATLASADAATSETTVDNVKTQTTVDILDTIPRYDPKIHGSYDATQPYAERYRILREREDKAKSYGINLFTHGITRDEQDAAVASFDQHERTHAPDGSVKVYFNRNTGDFQTADQGPSRHSDDAKSYRQMSAYFDVEAAANSNNGVSLKDERRKIKYTKEEIQQFKLKKEEKKRKKLLAWARS